MLLLDEALSVLDLKLRKAMRLELKDLQHDTASSSFERVAHYPDYDCRIGRMQLMVYFRGQKLGGLNRQALHWYFSKVFVREQGSPDLMTAHGFEHVVHNEKHDYWLGKGLNALARFEDAMVAMTGLRP
ncbi:hypothetical protein ruthe_03067 [Rubellimicrobium thermophilum DSM 16684]|uniref:Uncharacterized protein n=1 Tax=Rubellimicrobium thermophilum DSM 16684 TaxID=1123069 RepID=S9QT57_9RHOB|nr:hypothetical protein ruthe_03067 [Rubellimicrobium thermophilum DSM 16684]